MKSESLKADPPRSRQDPASKLKIDSAQRVKRIQKPVSKVSDPKPKKNFLSKLGLHEATSKAVSTVFTTQQYSDLPTINHYLLKQLTKSGFTMLTKIQTSAFGPISEGKDCVLKSETGSGKTLAYLVPLLNSLMAIQPKISRNDGCKLLIVCPIRELCLQIYKNLQDVGRACVNLVAGVLIGGEDIKSEKERIRKGLSIVIGTPGRIVYHLENTQSFALNKLSAIVFEECDRTLDMGFAKEIKSLLSNTKFELGAAQRVMVSASISEKVEELLHTVSRSSTADIEQSYEFIGFEGDKKELKTPFKLKHFYLFVDESRKLINCLTLLKLIEKEKIILFVSTADQANFIEMICCNINKPDPHNQSYSYNVPNTANYEDYNQGVLKQLEAQDSGEGIDPRLMKGLKAGRVHQEGDTANSSELFLNMAIYKIHGQMQQKERSVVFDEFTRSKSGLLICTDVGSRGLDFTDTKIIILFDVSPSYKDYINRVGRTARIDKDGAAISLLYHQEASYAARITESCQAQELLLSEIEDNLQETLNVSAKGVIGGLQFELVNCILRKNLNYLSRRAFNSFCRAYSRLRDEVSFSVKNLHLASVAKSYGLKSAMSNSDTHKPEYKTSKDAKDLSQSERAFLERKRLSTIQGLKTVRNKAFMNDEFLLNNLATKQAKSPNKF